MTRDHKLTDYDPEAIPESSRTITVGHVDEPHDIYGGRGRYDRHFGNCQPGTKGWLGNPYTLADHTRDEAIALFERDFDDTLRDWDHGHTLTNALLGLPGQVVACHCRKTDETEPGCHLDIIREKLLDGTIFRIARDEYAIPLADWQQEVAADE